MTMARPPKDPTIVRQQQREDWTTVAPNWGAPVFGAEVWAPRARLLALAGIRPGQRALDLACGTGNAALVERVGSEGYVLGLDLTPGMVRVGQEWVQQHGLRNVEFRVIESELELPVPATSFDVATCSFGLSYMPDPAGALRAVHQALKPGGRAAVVTWAGLDRVPFVALEVQILSRHLDPALLDLNGPGACALPTQEALASVFSAAGFTAVETETMHTDTVWDSPAAYWDFMAAMAWPLAMLGPKLSAEVLLAIREDALKTLGTLFPNGPVQFTNEVLLAAGTKAS
jgi:ubiquinone/menaquinone biosynthesis C-methylase UbiE